MAAERRQRFITARLRRPSWRACARGAIAALLLVLAGPGAAGNAPASSLAASVPPQRIVSLHLCADQLLLALAAPDQIAALGPYARDRQLSFFADRARNFTSIPAAAEAVVRRRPDLVIAGAFTSAPLARLLRRLGHRVLELDHVASLDDLRMQVRKVAAALGRRAEGERLLAELDATLARLEGRARGLSALYLQRQGVVTGDDTLMGEILRHAGFTNAAATLGVSGVGRAQLELVVRAAPDVLIVNEAAAKPEDQGSALLHHPVLRRLRGRGRRIVLPTREIVCPGPSTVRALRRLERALARPGAAAAEGVRSSDGVPQR